MEEETKTAQEPDLSAAAETVSEVPSVESAPVAEETPAPAVSEETAPVAEETPAPAAVSEETAPVAEEVPVTDAAAPAAQETPERRERIHKDVTPDMLERTQKDLMKMLDFLGHDDAVVKAEAVNDFIQLNIISEDAGRIIGRKGQSLESLQLLLNRMVQKDDPDYPRIFLSIDGYSTRHPDSRGHGKSAGAEGERTERSERPERPERPARGERRPRRDRGDRPERGERRERRDRRGGERRRFDGEGEGDGGERDEMLRQQALDAAKEVRLWGEPKTLPEMNAHDRRIIHITLESEADLSTESEGEGAKKSIVISMKK